MKQLFQPRSHSTQRHHPDPARAVYEIAAGGPRQLPLPKLDNCSSKLSGLAAAIEKIAAELQRVLGASRIGEFVTGARTAQDLVSALRSRWLTADTLRERMVALQEEIDWLVYASFGIASQACLSEVVRYDALTCPRGDRAFERLTQRRSTIRVKGRPLPIDEAEVAAVGSLPDWAEPTWAARVEAIEQSEELQLLESPVFKRAWRDTDQNTAEPVYRAEKDRSDLYAWFGERLETWASERSRPFTLAQGVAAFQDDPASLVLAEAILGRKDFTLEHIIKELLAATSVPNHPLHTYTNSGLSKWMAWAAVLELQRCEDADGVRREVGAPPEYSQGSRGKSTDFLKNEYWKLRGKLDVPKERFIAFTDVPGREGSDTLYGWAGWTPLQRLKAILAIDEELEDGGVQLADRVALLDSAWRLLPDVAREDATAASRLKAELQALVGTDGPSKEMLDDWRERFPPRGGRGRRKNGKATKKKTRRTKRTAKNESEAHAGEAPGDRTP